MEEQLLPRQTQSSYLWVLAFQSALGRGRTEHSSRLLNAALGEKEVIGMKLNNNTSVRLNPRHIKEIKGRGLPLEWAIANCHSISTTVASSRLGYSAKSDGILLEGVGIQIQFKPDKPWRDDKTKTAPKYRSPLGDYDAILLHHPDDPHFWNDLEALKEKAYKIDGHPCLGITEGVFTGIAMNAAGIATVVLLGVEMGLTSAKNDES